jgi:hypothetical protein
VTLIVAGGVAFKNLLRPDSQAHVPLGTLLNLGDRSHEYFFVILGPARGAKALQTASYAAELLAVPSNQCYDLRECGRAKRDCRKKQQYRDQAKFPNHFHDERDCTAEIGAKRAALSSSPV